MRLQQHLLFPLLAAAAAIAEMTTITEVIILEPTTLSSRTSTPSSTVSFVHKQETSLSISSSVESAISTSNLNSDITSSALSTTSSSAEVASAASTVSAQAANDDSSAYNGGQAGSGSAVDTDAGASGSGSTGAGVGQGGLIAIIIVVIIVAIFGIVSTVLFVLAKRRQWNVRASIRRASRRFTSGLRTPGGPRTPGVGNRRTTVNAGRLGGDVRAVHPPKKGVVVGTRQVDVEKGVLAGKAPKNTRAEKVGGERGWAQRLWGNDWK